MRSIVALAAFGAVVLSGASAALGEGDAPLRLRLVAANGVATMHVVRRTVGEPAHEIEMRLPWSVESVNADGTAHVRIGPPRFSGPGAPPRWPTGGYGLFDLTADDRDDHWSTQLPHDASAEDTQRLQEMLSAQYSTGVGIVRLPEQVVRVGGEWSFEHFEPREGGGLTTRYHYRLLAHGKRFRVAVQQSTHRAGAKDEPALETVRGEISYDVDKPLPVDGWLETTWAGGSVAYRFR